MIPPALLDSIRCFPDEVGPKEQLARWYDQQGDVRGAVLRIRLELRGMITAAAGHGLAGQGEDRTFALINEYEALRQEYEPSWRQEWGLREEEHIGFCDRGLFRFVLTWDRLWEIGDHLLSTAPFIDLELRDGVVDAQRLATWEGLSTLDVLTLSDSNLGVHGARFLASSEYLRRLRILRLNDTYIGDLGVSVLSQASSTFSNLRTLHVNNNSLGPSAARDLATSTAFPALTFLDISNNQIEAAGAGHLGSSAWIASLDHLDLSSNVLGDEGARALANASLIPRFKWLSLRNNRIGLGGARFLSRSPFLSCVQMLDLSQNHLGSDGYRVLRTSFKNLKLF